MQLTDVSAEISEMKAEIDEVKANFLPDKSTRRTSRVKVPPELSLRYILSSLSSYL